MNTIRELNEKEVNKILGDIQEIENDRSYYEVKINGRQYYVISNFVPPNKFKEKEKKNRNKINQIKEENKKLAKELQEAYKELETLFQGIIENKDYEDTEKTKKILKLQESIRENKNNIDTNNKKMAELNKQISNDRDRQIQIMDLEEEKSAEITAKEGQVSEIVIQLQNKKEVMRNHFYSKLTPQNKTQVNIQKKSTVGGNIVEKSMFPNTITYHLRTANKKGEKIMVTTGYSGEEHLLKRIPSSMKILIEDLNKETTQEYIIKVGEDGKYKLVDQAGKEKVINMQAFEKRHEISLQPTAENLERYKQTQKMNVTEILNSQANIIYSLVKEKEQVSVAERG